ncbi:DUF3854 domain-containing protein [Nostoc punctiforme FACHB-252]|uniref:DUF3854 domain-containing protein n=1 Tax=Nostoc punctiforme FACHB-252 TaxID=1357509 RepID=A0ABR8HKU3_NOSPU|nr:DUF3854 domain-containing protein [Nostoc punctiforme]MBD2615839.1 DUF3854 domain-containing protein [Nostoc punctiforme FACHB-252]
MFDERHLQLTSAYAHSSEYFIRNVIYPLAKYIDEYIKQKVEASINKRLYWETGKQTYAMSRDGNGGWKWEKYEPKSNEFVTTTASEQQQAASTLTNSIFEGVMGTTANESVAQNPTSSGNEQLTEDLVNVDQNIIAETEQAKSLDNQTVVNHQKSNGKIGFSVIDEETNKVVVDEKFILELQADINKYLAECLSTWRINQSAFKQDLGAKPLKIDKHLAEILKIVFSSQTPQIETNNNQLNLHSDQDIPPAPAHIDTQHWQELVGKSAIAPGIAEINFKSLHIDPIEQEHQAWEHLLYSDKIKRLNTGQLSKGWRDAYSHIEAGGWWCNSGVDSTQFKQLTPAAKSSWKAWGCYKPNQPRPKRDKDTHEIIPGKFTKYEHPPGIEKSIFLLDIPDDIALQIYQKAQVNPTDSDRCLGFWYCAWKHNVPIIITEGAKKAASLLSQGHAAIGLAGINGGYYKTNNQLKNPIDNKINTQESEEDATLAAIEPDEIEAIDDNEIDDKNALDNATHFLHPELAVFATTGRDFKICFDFDTTPKTKKNVDAATLRTGQLLEANGGEVSVISLPGPDKGVDDFIVTQGSEAFAQLQAQALPIKEWDNQRCLELRSNIKLKDGTVRKVGQKDRTVAIAQDNVALQTPINQSKQENLITQTPSSSSAESSQLRDKYPSANQTTPAPASTERQQHNDTVAPVSTDNKQSPPSNTTNETSDATNKQQSLPNTTAQNQSASQNQQPTNSQTDFPSEQIQMDTGSFSWFPWKKNKPINETSPLKPIPNWAKTQDVILYQDNYRRRQLEDKENQAIAQAAVALVKKYGVATKDNQLTYQADAFTIDKKGEDYTIYRRHDGKPLMTFMADRWSQVRRVNLAQDFNTENYPINILPVERQEFLLVADYLKSGKQLPSVDDDPRKIACVLSSVSPSGTHNILESFKQPQVLQIMMGAIRNFEKDDLILGNYRILFQQGSNGKSSLQLFKTELGGLLTREAVRFEFEKTETGMTHQVTKMAIDEADLEKLGLLAQKLHINYKALFGDPNDTRDIDLPVHPAIKSQLQKLEGKQANPSPLTSDSVSSLLSGQEDKVQAAAFKGEISSFVPPAPYPPVSSASPTDATVLAGATNQTSENFQPDCYLQKLQSPLEQSTQTQPDAKQSLSNLLNKLSETSLLTIGEQRHLYQELLIQSQLQRDNLGTTDISLPPLNDILEDLIKQRQQIINQTYTPKVKVHQKSHTPQQPVTNSQELEL